MTGQQGLNIINEGENTIVKIDTQHIDYRNTEAIKSTINKLVEDGNKRIILDLTNVTFMDSSGLSILLFCKRACEGAKGSFAARGLQTYVDNLVSLTNLNKSIDILSAEKS